MANKSLTDLYADFRKATQDMEKLKGNLPRIIGVEAVRIVKQNFTLQGYDDGNNVTPWPARAQVTDDAYDYNRTNKYRTKTGKKSTYKNPYKGSVYSSKNPILEQTRNLYMAIQYAVAGSKVTIGVDTALLPYAQKMNEGGDGTWGNNPTHTPARQYVPKPDEPANPKIIAAVVKKLEFEKDKIMRDFKK